MKILFSIMFLSLLFITGCEAVAGERHVYSGKPRFAYGFSSHMVLQRNSKVNIWGFANPGTRVAVSLGGQKVTGKADGHGKWLVQFASMGAGGPHVLQLESGGTVVKLDNVMLGDVWICSGQSNMRYGLDRQTGKDKDGPRVFADELATLLKQRTFPIRHAMDDRGSLNWLEVTHQNVVDRKRNRPGVTAVGYFFAKHLRKNLGDVPIGIIQTGAGGKAIRHFIPKDVQWANPALRAVWSSRSYKGPTYWELLLEKNSTEKLADHENAINAWLNGESSSEACPAYMPNYPGYLFYKAMPQLKAMKFKGMVWYQGESDAGRSAVYPQHLEALIDFYRDYFEFPGMPFIVVMLPPYKSRHYPQFVAGQLSLADRKRGVGAAYAPEAGDKQDIHPPKKDIIGERVALTALAEGYDKDIAYLGPRYESAERLGDRIKVRFRDTAGGLKLANGRRTLNGFQMGTTDDEGSFENAGAEIGIGSDYVDVMVPEGFRAADAIHLRYNWTAFYIPVLYGGNDLPALPFSKKVLLR